MVVGSQALTPLCGRRCSPKGEWFSFAVEKSTDVARDGPSLCRQEGCSIIEMDYTKKTRKEHEGSCIEHLGMMTRDQTLPSAPMLWFSGGQPGIDKETLN